MTSYPAPAKINLHLKVTRTLENGYHELDTSFVYVDVEDELQIASAERLIVTCTNPAFNGTNNLVHQLLEAFQKKHGISSGISVHINKKLPDQAGLGGGSSDAATALWVANTHWGLNLSVKELISFATPFGADIPCFLFGRASLAEGVGEKLTDYPDPLPEGVLLLAYPGIGLSTPVVFQCYDEMMKNADGLTRHDSADTIRGLSGRAVGHNDLESCACAISGEVMRLLEQMRKLSEKAWMSGSGSTCVALFADHQQAESAASLLIEKKLATWTHIGKLLGEHPMQSRKIGA
ncbi:MAG TPA: 4-(cytidine 5'-diphospho)-2-C-methyl-D-erythritol kinase [Mariprofundaceae bacterium]|nr:4-(cytidine 5'-diphospho)-2-C-methyl-D-erythritol kinase [Mariprofundaceae bacterium]